MPHTTAWCTMREHGARPGRRMRRVCTGLRVHRYSMSKQSGNTAPGQGASGYAREEDAVSVYGYTDTLCVQLCTAVYSYTGTV